MFISFQKSRTQPPYLLSLSLSRSLSSPHACTRPDAALRRRLRPTPDPPSPLSPTPIAALNSACASTHDHDRQHLLLLFRLPRSSASPPSDPRPALSRCLLPLPPLSALDLTSPCLSLAATISSTIRTLGQPLLLVAADAPASSSQSAAPAAFPPASTSPTSDPPRPAQLPLSQPRPLPPPPPPPTHAAALLRLVAAVEPAPPPEPLLPPHRLPAPPPTAPLDSDDPPPNSPA